MTEVWYAYEATIKGHFVGVIYGTSRGDARLRAWDWFGVSTPYLECIKLNCLGPLHRDKVADPEAKKGWKHDQLA